MPTLRTTFTVLTVLGCKRPLTWTTRNKKLLYKTYSVMALIFTYVQVLTAFMDMILNVADEDEFSDNLYTLLPSTVAFCKMCSFIVNHKSIMILINSMHMKPYSPADTAEMQIETRLDTLNERIATFMLSMFGSCMVVIWTSSLIRDPKNKALAFRAWLPFDYTVQPMYSFTYAHQAISVLIATFMNVAYDTLFSGVMFCIYSQLEILGHRLQNLNRDQKDMAKQCVRHHNFLFDLAKNVNKDFRLILSLQLMTSMMIMCFILYRILERGLGSRIIETFVYASCFLLQIFYYCWYGNEVRLKSLEISDFIMNSNWASLDDNTKKILLMMMMRSTFPIQFTSAHIFLVNNDTFMGVLKTSYSVYNVLSR